MSNNIDGETAKLNLNCFQRKSIHPAERYSDRWNDLGSSYVEHHLTVSEVSEVYADSHINEKFPERSEGLSSNEAKKRLKDGGANIIELPKEINDIALFAQQFFNMFSLSLFGAAILSIAIYFIHLAHGNYEPVNLYCSLILFAIVFIMCTLSFYQQRKALQAVSDFKALLSQSCLVLRDCEERQIACEDLVVGDVVILSAGARIPADLRIIKSAGLQMETSAITGDTDPIDYTHEVAAPHIGIIDARNIAFKGSFCIEGDGFGVVIRTGKYTILGGIADIHQQVGTNKSNFQIELDQYIRYSSFFALCLATVVFLAACIITKFQNVLDHLIIGFVVIIVANIPQGLPAIAMSQMAIIARRLVMKNIYTKKLDIINELGATTVVATDKTGSLTQNLMVVTDMWYNGRYHSGHYDIMHSGLSLRQRKDSCSQFEQPLPDILSVMSVCNKAHFERVHRDLRRVWTEGTLQEHKRRWSVNQKAPKIFTVVDTQTGKRTSITASNSDINAEYASPEHSDDRKDFGTRSEIFGSPSDVALLRYVEMNASVENIRLRYQVVFEVPFNSIRRYHLVVARCIGNINEIEQPGLEEPHDNEARFCIMLKGAPEVVLNNCSCTRIDDDFIQIDEEIMKNCEKAWEHYGNDGKLVIAFAIKYFNEDVNKRFVSSKEIFEKGLIFLGMVAIMDPPRSDAASAIRQCKEAGIKVFMITGDHMTTATAIARKIGLVGDGEVSKVENSGQGTVKLSVRGEEKMDWIVVNGADLSQKTEREWDDLLRFKYIVFARSTPEQKLQIVRECQKRGEVVAVTGGGVNDVPALANANIGIAMGLRGCDIAKQVADIVLTDDNFASIVKGLEEGRLLFDNLRMSIAYTLTHIWPEIIPVILHFLLGLPLGLSPLQILSIDLASELPPAISLAYQLPERDIMKIPPRGKKDRLVSLSLLIYSYLLAGSIITFGCILAYLYVYNHHNLYFSDIVFTAETHWKLGGENLTTASGIVLNVEEQLNIKNEAAAAWQITLVLSQVFHFYMCSTRRVSLFVRGVTNLISIFAIIIEVLLLNLFIYTPAAQYIMYTKAPPSVVWLLGPAVGLALLIFSETRKFYIRRYPEGIFIRLLKW